VYIGFTPGAVAEIRAVRDWLEALGLRDAHPEAFWLDVGIERGGVHFSELGQDVVATAIYGAIRTGLDLVAAHLPARDFFLGAAERGLSTGVVASIEEVLEDPHTRARGFPVAVPHDLLGRDVVHPGAPFSMHGSPWRITSRAPRLGEHDHELADRPRAG
jgi:hypothetical protein